MLLQETLDGTGSVVGPSKGSVGRSRSHKSGGRLSLQQLRERSQLMDVPLIAALCSDTSLISHPGRTPSTDSTTAPNIGDNASLTQPDAASAPSSHAWQLDPASAAQASSSSHVTTDAFSHPLLDLQPVLPSAKQRQRGLKAARRYSVSGVYTTNQVPVAHIKPKCGGGKTFSGVHHHPNKKTSSSQQTQSSPKQPVNDPTIITKVIP